MPRDLMPGNAWFTGDGTAQIGDFGLAVAIDRSRLTTEGMMVGTAPYMPPSMMVVAAPAPVMARSRLARQGGYLRQQRNQQRTNPVSFPIIPEGTARRV